MRFQRDYRNIKLAFFLLTASLLIYYISLSYPSQEAPKSYVQIEWTDEGFGDQLFTLFSLLGIASSLNRIPVINVAENPSLVDSLSTRIASKFPLVLQQFLIVIEPKINSNAILRYDKRTGKLENPSEKFSEYTAQTLVVKTTIPRRFDYFNHLRPSIRKWMMGNAEHVQEARELLPIRYEKDFKICVHLDSEADPSLIAQTSSSLVKLLKKYSQEQQEKITVVMSSRGTSSQSALRSKNVTEFRLNQVFLNAPVEVQLTFSTLFCDVVLLSDSASDSGLWIGFMAKGNSVYHVADMEFLGRSEHSTISTNDEFVFY